MFLIIKIKNEWGEGVFKYYGWVVLNVSKFFYKFFIWRVMENSLKWEENFFKINIDIWKI